MVLKLKEHLVVFHHNAKIMVYICIKIFNLQNILSFVNPDRLYNNSSDSWYYAHFTNEDRFGFREVKLTYPQLYKQEQWKN